MEDSDADYTIKVILVGSSGVGKTSLVSSFFDNPFENQDLPTVAPASCAAIMEVEGGKRVELQIWDTAGQERFQAISQMFYRDSHVAFVCFDPRQPEPVQNWISRVRSEVPECIIYLVATKADTLKQEEINELNAKASDMLTNFKAKNFLTTSAKTGAGVRDLFESAAQCCFEIFKSNEPQREEKKVKVTGKSGGKNGGCC